MTDFEFKQTAVAQYTEEELNEMSKTLVKSIFEFFGQVYKHD